MNRYGKYFILPVFYYAIISASPAKLAAQNRSVAFISESIPTLKQTVSDINQNVLAMLTLIKEYEKNGQAINNKVARILKPQIPVKETDNTNSLTVVEVRMNEEFLIIEEHDKWYKIKTKDNREGWVPEEDVQVVMKQLVNNGLAVNEPVKRETSILLAQIARYMRTIDDIYRSADQQIKSTEEEYNKLSAEDKSMVANEYLTFVGYKEKIKKSYGYATRFIQPYESLLATAGTSQALLTSTPGDRFNGTLSADLGRSSYLNGTPASTTSRRLAFDGIYQLDRFTKVNVAFNNQKELIKTAYTGNTFDAGISRQFDEKLVLGSSFNYNSYSDAISENNSFGMLRASVNVSFRPTRKTTIFGNTSYQSKNYKGSDDNNYNGFLYVLGANLIPDSRNNLRFQIQGNSQFSKKDFLNFNQISPQITYSRKNGQDKMFSIGFDYDLLKFTTTNNFSDYQKYRADLRWRNSINKMALAKSLNMTYKQYPNNRKQDYFKLGYTLEVRQGSLNENKSSVSSFNTVLNIITQRKNNFLTDYLDLRWDRTGLKPRFYSNTNIYVRFWNNFERITGDTSKFQDHFIDFYNEFGPSFRNIGNGDVKISSLKFGFTFGGHVFFFADKENVWRNGNSARIGLALNSTIRIYKGSLAINATGELSGIICKKVSYVPTAGSLSFGKTLYRFPKSLQFNIDYRQPISKSWDLHLNVGTYIIKTDSSIETGINPVGTKSSLRISGGLVYRFAL